MLSIWLRQNFCRLFKSLRSIPDETERLNSVSVISQHVYLIDQFLLR